MGRRKSTDRIDVFAEASSPLRNQIEKSRSKKGNYVLDLKVNSPASMSYLGVEGLDSAPAIVRLSKVKGLDVIAITDLYSGEFIDRMTAAAEGSPLTVIPGVSVRCRVGACDEVMLTCLFPETTRSADIAAFLSALQVPPSARGSSDYILNHTLDKVLHTLESFSGIAIPSRIDKTPNRMSVLGELVETYGFRGFDLAYVDSQHVFKKRWPKLKFHLFSFSDANALAQIGSRIARVRLAAPGFAGIKDIIARDQRT